MKNNQVRKIIMIAIFTALSTVLYFFPKFPISGLFPSFLKVQFSNLPVVIAGFALGPLEGLIIIVLRFLIKLPLSSSLFVGEVADALIGIAYIIPSALYYKKRHTKNGALIALIIGTISWVLIGLLSNYLFLVPAYIEIYMGGNISAFVGACSIIPGINETNYMIRYLLIGVLPFNLLLSSVVSFVTFFVYKRISFLIH